MCLRYPPTVVACVCIHLACRWSKYRIPLSAQKKEWFYYIDTSATQELLDRLTGEFLAIFEKCPSRLRKKIMDCTQVSLLTQVFRIILRYSYCRVKKTKTSDWPSEEAIMIHQPCWQPLLLIVVLQVLEAVLLLRGIIIIETALMPTTKCHQAPLDQACNSIKLASMQIQPCLIQT